MKIAFLVRAVVVSLLIPVAASAAALDDYYLSQFDKKPQLNRALSAVAGLEPAQAERCRTHLYRSLKRDFKALEPATQKVLGKYVERPVLTGQLSSSSAPTYNSPGGHFTIHYTRTGSDAPDLTDADVDGVPDWVEKVASVFDQVWAAEVTAMGYRQPPVTRYDVYLLDLVPDQSYGFTSDDGAPTGSTLGVTSYIEIDKAFSDDMFTVNGRYTPEQMLQATAAHEFHHAIQFGYNYYFEFWYAEVSATWIEDEVFDSVNQLYSYLPKYVPDAGRVSLNGGLGNNSEYGRWIFNRYLAEGHGTQVVRNAWEKLGTLSPSSSPISSSGDIQMAPVLDSLLATSYGSTLAADFLGFAKRIYTRDWNSHVSDLAQIPSHASSGSFSIYPVTSASTPAPAVTLPRYTFVFYRFVPSASVPVLSISVSKTSGIETAVFKKSGGVISEIAPGAGGATYSVSGFGTMNPGSDEVVLLIANTSNLDGHQASFSNDGSGGVVKEPVPAGDSSGGGGCFIATAAYGSYLHPKVAELRSFRDRYLLTNAPGRRFVSLYYRVSPPIARVISEHEWMKGGVRLLLLPLVFGVEHPGGVLLVLLTAAGGVAWRLARRRTAAMDATEAVG